MWESKMINLFCKCLVKIWAHKRLGNALFKAFCTPPATRTQRPTKGILKKLQKKKFLLKK